jgi:hypothetical protein
MYRPLQSAKRTEQLRTELRLGLWVAQEQDFATNKAQLRRQIARPDFVSRQIVLRAVALTTLARNQAAE